MILFASVFFFPFDVFDCTMSGGYTYNMKWSRLESQ